MENIITRVEELYTYNAEAGTFSKVGKTEDIVGKTGLRVDGKKVSRTVIAWVLTYGEKPSTFVRFKDGDNSNFSLENLQLSGTNNREVRRQAELVKSEQILKDMQEQIEDGYDEMKYKVINISGPNKAKLEELGYQLPYGVDYNWLVEIKDLIDIGSNELVKVSCSDCGKVRETKAYRGNSVCRSCSKKGVVFTREHRARISRAKIGQNAGEKNHFYGKKYARPEDHPSYNHSLTAEDRAERRLINGYYEWTYEVKKQAEFTCEACGDNRGGNLVSHHKEGYSMNKERRIDVTNGVCLCDTCHKDFHGAYGYGDNTVDQFEEWVLNKLEESEVA